MKIIILSVLSLALTGIAAFGADTKGGQTAYDKSCKGCHGATGVASPAMAKVFPTMSDLGSAKVQGLSDADLDKVITEGKGKMKPVKTLSGSPDDVVAYVRTFKK